MIRQNQENWDPVQRLTLKRSIVTNRMLPDRRGMEIESNELWGSRFSKMEVGKYGVAWLSVEYSGEVGSIYLCALNMCMSDGGEGWSV